MRKIQLLTNHRKPSRLWFLAPRKTNKIKSKFFSYLNKIIKFWSCEKHTFLSLVTLNFQWSKLFLSGKFKSLNARVWLRWKPVDNWVSCVLWQRNALQSWVTLLEELFCSGGAASAIERRATQPETATLPCILNWTKSTSSGHFLTFAKTRKSPESRCPNSYI